VTFRAGATTVDITPPAGVLMDGYGGRREPSRGVHDPLFVRVLVLECEGESFAIMSCDLLAYIRLSPARCGVSRRNAWESLLTVFWFAPPTTTPARRDCGVGCSRD